MLRMTVPEPHSNETFHATALILRMWSAHERKRLTLEERHYGK